MKRFTFHLIQHTHWDREWYLPHAAFRARLIAAFGSALDLLESDPAARFLADGQSVLVEDVLAVRPDWRDRVARAVAAGQLEVGPWYILADENIPAAESLVRNLLCGTRQSLQLGSRMDVVYSPDAFGHPAILPTLGHEFGIERGVVWRGLEPAATAADLYRWAGPDGRELLVYQLPPQGYEIGADLGERPDRLAVRWRHVRASLTARAATGQVAVFVGADHHAPLADPSALIAAIAALEPGHDVHLSSLTEFFDAIAASDVVLPQRSGELRSSSANTWALQGVHATRTRLKRRHSIVELALQRRGEPLVALAWWHGADTAHLTSHTWRTLLQCQFHDTLCGCCADAVAREQDVRLTSVQSAEVEMTRAALHRIIGHDPDRARTSADAAAPTLVVWNGAARPRGGVMTAEIAVFRGDLLVGPPSDRVPLHGPGFRSCFLRTDGGGVVPVQVLDVQRGVERIDAARHYPDLDEVDRVRIAFDAPAVAGMGLAALRLAAGDVPIPEAGLQVGATHIRNRFVEVHIGPNGQVLLTDRRSGERFVNLLQLFDELDEGDSYTPFVPPDAPVAHAKWSAPRVLARGPYVGALQLTFTIDTSRRDRIHGSATLLLHADSPMLRVRLVIDNAATDHRFRIRVPVGGGVAAIAGAAFGFERRTPVALTPVTFPAEVPVTTAPAHRYVGAGTRTRALAVVFPGFAEYEWTPDAHLILTLLRATGELSRANLPTRPGRAAWSTAIPEAQELGRHVAEFGIVAVDGTSLERPDTLDVLWEEAFLPLQPTFIRDFVGTVDPRGNMRMELVGEGLVHSALKVAENGRGLIVRCYNATAIAVEGCWMFGVPIARACMVRADETVLGCIEVRDRQTVRFVAPPRGVVTLLIEPEAQPPRSDAP